MFKPVEINLNTAIAFYIASLTESDYTENEMTSIGSKKLNKELEEIELVRLGSYYYERRINGVISIDYRYQKTNEGYRFFVLKNEAYEAYKSYMQTIND